jgi:hypothetical protein
VGALLETISGSGCTPSLFVAGLMVREIEPELREADERGCEIGAHGWAHCEDPSEDFRTLSFERQMALLARTAVVIEACLGSRPRLFRAPNLWLGGDTVRALQETGYRIDSSIPSGRVDPPGGRISTSRYLRAPRVPYELSIDDVRRRGHSGVVEVPLLSAIVPINMMALRLLGSRVLASLSTAVARRDGYVIFYCHPAEFGPRQAFASETVPRRHRYRVGVANLALLRNYIERLRVTGLKETRIDALAASAIGGGASV